MYIISVTGQSSQSLERAFLKEFQNGFSWPESMFFSDPSINPKQPNPFVLTFCKKEAMRFDEVFDAEWIDLIFFELGWIDSRVEDVTDDEIYEGLIICSSFVITAKSISQQKEKERQQPSKQPRWPKWL